jgi:uncharacterized protein (TIGR03067 family)
VAARRSQGQTQAAGTARAQNTAAPSSQNILEEAPRKTDKEAIQGRWTVVALEVDGWNEAADEIRGVRITADRFFYKLKGDSVEGSTYRLDQTQRPKHIDLAALPGEPRPLDVKGIYFLDGDRLVLCFDMQNGKRPLDFKTEPKSGMWLLVLQRDKRFVPPERGATGSQTKGESAWVVAPVAGMVFEIREGLKAGSRLKKNQELLRIFDAKAQQAVAVLAPFDSVLLDTNVRETLLHRYVNRNERLLRIAPLARPARYRMEILVCRGDPHGKSIEAATRAGTMEVLSRTNIDTEVGQEAVNSGGLREVWLGDESVRTGWTLRLNPAPDPRGIRMNMALTNVEVLEQAKDHFRWRTDESRLTRVVKSGELLKLGGPKIADKQGSPRSASDQIWAEVRVREVP